MKRTLFIILTACCGVITLQQAFAQKTNKKKPAANVVKPASKIPEVDVTLGNSSLKGGNITKKAFDSLIKQGVMAADGASVEGFMFSYSERNYYEDSVGNPIRVMDHMEEFCPGNKLSAIITESIFQRTKPGDTAYIEQIKVKQASGSEAKGKSMKFAIVAENR